MDGRDDSHWDDDVRYRRDLEREPRRRRFSRGLPPRRLASIAQLHDAVNASLVDDTENGGAS